VHKWETRGEERVRDSMDMSSLSIHAHTYTDRDTQEGGGEIEEEEVVEGGKR
jgi:hypothetical protein